MDCGEEKERKKSGLFPVQREAKSSLFCFQEQPGSGAQEGNLSLETKTRQAWISIQMLYPLFSQRQ